VCSLLLNVQTGCGAHSALFSISIDFFVVGKRLGCDADYSSPSSAEVKNKWMYISIPVYVIFGVDSDSCEFTVCAYNLPGITVTSKTLHL
jgi:hypothetical protein